MAFGQSFKVPTPTTTALDEPMQAGGPVLTSDSYNGISRFGLLQARPGFPSIAGTSEAVVGFFRARKTNGQIRLIVGTTKRWYEYAVATQVLTDVSGGVLLSNVLSNPAIFALYIQAGALKIIGCNDVDATKTWDLDSAGNYASIAGAPIARSLCVATSRVVYGRTQEGGTTFPVRVRWSAVGDYTSYPTGAFVDLVDTSGHVMSVRSFGRNAFAVYKEDAQYIGFAVQGASDAGAFQVNPIDHQPGPSGPAAIDDGPGGTTHVYLGIDGNLYLFDGVRTTLIAELHNWILDRWAFGSALANNTFLRYLPAKQEIWMLLALDSDVVPQHLIVYSLKTKGVMFQKAPTAMGVTALGVCDQITGLTVNPLTSPNLLLGVSSTDGLSSTAFSVANGTQDPSIPNTIPVDWQILLPVVEGNEYEFDAVEAHIGALTTAPAALPPNVNVTVSVKVGPMFDKLTEITLGTINPRTGVDGTATAQKIVVNPGDPANPMRGKVVIVRFQASTSSTVGFSLRYLEIYRFTRKKATP